MRLHGGTVDQHLRGRPACRCQNIEDVDPYALGRPSDEAEAHADELCVRPAITGADKRRKRRRRSLGLDIRYIVTFTGAA